MAVGASAGRLRDPLQDPLFQTQPPPIDPAAPVDTSALLAQGEQAFPPLADVPVDEPAPPAPAATLPDQVAPPPAPDQASDPTPLSTAPQGVKIRPSIGGQFSPVAKGSIFSRC